MVKLEQKRNNLIEQFREPTKEYTPTPINDSFANKQILKSADNNSKNNTKNNTKNKEKILSDEMTKKINNIIKNIKEQKLEINKKKCPNEITLEMLKQAMGSSLELETINNKDSLWYAYSSVMFCNNPYGLILDSNMDKKTEADSNIKLSIPLITPVSK